MNHCNDIEAPDAFASSARSSASLRTDFLEELSVLNFRELSEKTEKNMAPTSILDFIREDLLAHFSFPFWLHIMIGQLTGCSKKRAKADWLMTCAKADWLRTNVLTFFLLSDWLVQNLPLF